MRLRMITFALVGVAVASRSGAQPHRVDVVTPCAAYLQPSLGADFTGFQPRTSVGVTLAQLAGR